MDSTEKSRLFRARIRLRRLLQHLARTGRLPARPQRRKPAAVLGGSKTNEKVLATGADRPAIR